MERDRHNRKNQTGNSQTENARTEDARKEADQKVIRFRNHISVILEQTGAVIIALVILAVTQLAENVDELLEADWSFLADRGALIVLAVMAFFVITIISQVFIWFKTYIYLEDNAVVLEKGSVNKKKNTIGIRNISNINLEQNVLEILLGTCKVKIDTNSRSTADSTDLKIVLKKADAQWFKQEIMGRMRAAGSEIPFPGEAESIVRGTAPAGEKGGETPQAARDSEESGYDVTTDIGDILRHGLYSVSIVSVLILLLVLVGSVVTAVQTLSSPHLMQSLLGAAAGVMSAAIIVMSALWDTIKDFIRYFDFRAKRRGNRLYIKYGFFKRVEYTIPVDKIQALKIRQSFVARIGHRYMAEIVNVGMGDEAAEKDSFLALYCTEEKLREQISLLLPEFSPAFDTESERVPSSVWAAWSIPAAVWVICLAVAAALFGSAAAEYRLFGWLGAGAAAAITLLCMILKYFTDRVGADERFLKICRGYFGKQYLAVRHRDIQYAEFSQNFVAKALGIRKGEIHLLASSSNTSHGLPYFRTGREENLEETVKRGMLTF